MIVTETEARGKMWCPFARVNCGEVGYNRLDEGEASDCAYCLGSHCMLWMPDGNRGYCGLSRCK